MTQSAWPNGKQIAVSFNVMYEQWSEGVAPGLGPMGNPLPAGHLDHQAISWAGYGMRTGIWRLLDLFEEQSIKGSYFVSGRIGDTAPETVAAITAAGHEICGHSWAQDILPVILPYDDERTSIENCVRALEKAGGQRPVGWISPRCTPSTNTADLLTEFGFTWSGDVFDTEEPYRVTTQNGELTLIPFGLDVNDVPLTLRYGRPAEEFAADFDATFDAMSSEPSRNFIDVTVHAHVGSRPRGLSALRSVMVRAKANDAIWITTRGAIADLI